MLTPGPPDQILMELEFKNNLSMNGKSFEFPSKLPRMPTFYGFLFPETEFLLSDAHFV